MAVSRTLEEAGELATFSARALKDVPGSARFFSETLRHAGTMITGSTILLFVMMMFIGASIANATYFLLRALGAGDYLGVISGYVVPRQVTAGMFGYVFAAKVCCGAAATIGAMRINQEIDALESNGVRTLQYVVAPRVLATLIFAPIATAVCLVGGLAGSYVESVVLLEGLSGASLTTVHWSVQSTSDQLFAFVSILAIGVSSMLTACYYGLKARGGPDAVGLAVSRSLAVNLVMQHVIASIFVVAFYGNDIRLPIGGG
jgi:phospholipid/cholesterol/gamma-HCH transport system permease protein